MNNETVTNKRIEWIDVAKGITIILVGIGHYQCPKLLQTWIYIFHMPLFFTLSGITLSIKKYNFLEFFLRKVKTLILPWIIALCINVCFQTICRMVGISANPDKITSIPLRIIINLRPGDTDPIYWFLPCLFVTELVLYGIFKSIINKKIIIVFFIVLLVVAIGYQKTINIRLPWELDILPMSAFFVGVGFVVKGYLLNIINNINKKKKLILILIFLILGTTIGFFNAWIIKNPVDMSSGRYGIVPLMVIAAICNSYAIVLLCTLINNRILRYIGENSLLFYLAQPIAYKIVDILLILLFSLLPIYSYSYGGNAFNLLLLHVCTNIGILVYVIGYKKVKQIVVHFWSK